MSQIGKINFRDLKPIIKQVGSKLMLVVITVKIFWVFSVSHIVLRAFTCINFVHTRILKSNV